MTSAVVLDGPGAFRLAPHTPRPPGHGEALVRVHAAGVCGSDREVYEGNRAPGYVRYPLTPGHEWSGTVEAVGEGVPGALVGRGTVGEGFRNCQVCARCHAGDTTLCTAGYDETGFTAPGAMAPTLTLPARLLHVLPDGVDLTAAALLEPAACVAAAVLKAEPRPGDRAAVVGAGTLAMLALRLLSAASPAELLSVGPHSELADRAHKFGATHYRTESETQGGTDSAGGAGGMGGEGTPGSGARVPYGDFDLVIEAGGSATAARTSASLLRRGGRLVLTGLPAPGAHGLDPATLVMRQTEVRTVFGAAPAAWAHAVRAFSAGLLDPLPLVTHELRLSEFPRAMELVGAPGVGKVLLRP
ncbi:zinc-dependent alcohol dehydrogenase [Streptomyces iconiensis]|uniref:2-deoxy-scyllo-inosamine dehydrogenase n=1 Tax=Streptomyces iconiensis TaxID=1384038 RepID=A0ABT6ZQZ2_9ACTN|nr:alcohol dehydrogenase catalytic domain-containing protein [Streptomyces iconiensis]MDJ1130948.1 alcohol dehydrogenase catalytic domain-containing protein [Streptomyces iconiensis]